MPPNEDLRQSPSPIFNAGEMPGPWPQGKFRLFVVKFQPLNDSTEHSEHSPANTSHSAEYIKIVPHPHNIGAKTITIPLDATTMSTMFSVRGEYRRQPKNIIFVQYNMGRGQAVNT